MNKESNIQKEDKNNNLVGQKFNRLTALKDLGFQENGKRYYLFKCDCGTEKKIYLKSVKSGATKSCGCIRIEKITKHGKSRSPLYNVHMHMIHRCERETDPAYMNYGGRGIKVCEEWLGDKGYENFYDWAMGNGYKKGLTLDRIENDKGYTPDNCRWTDMFVQANNKRSSLIFTYEGKTLSLIQWSRELSLNYSALLARIRRYNYPFEKAITYKIERIKI